MPSAIVTHLTPDLVEPGSLEGSLAIVIDILRASSTITAALAAGAAAVVPLGEISQARAAAAGLTGAVLGGERGGVRIEGFDLGNSPAEYTRAAVGGRTVLFTTTNGTRALERCAAARRVLVGSFLNLSAVIRAAAAFDGVVHLVCAGVSGKVCLEDVYAAGALAEGIGRGSCELDDASQLAVTAWRAVKSTPLDGALRAAHGGRNLVQIGLAGDIARCAAVDSLAIVAEMVGGRLVAARG